MIALRTFGALELTATDGSVVSSVLAQPRRAALLCYLALATPRGFHRRDHLFALFWPERDAEQARHALRQSVYFLRRELGPLAIVSRGDDELSLASGQVRCDAWEFASALDQGRVLDALALYRGELLAGFHISDAPEFERWVEAERCGLRDQAREAAWTLALAREGEGDASGAAEAARAALALAPTDEIAFRRLALLLERVGDRAASLRAYEAFASRLRDEYELEPSAETQGLVARIRAGAGDAVSLSVAQDVGPERGSRPLALPPWPPAVLPASRARHGTGLVAAAVTVALVLGLAWLQFRIPSRDAAAGVSPVPIGEPARAIAVLPFLIRDDSLAHWREGLMDLVSMNLAGIPGLRALDGRTVLARWREQVRDPESAAGAALEVAERAGGRYAVAGGVIAEGPDLLLTASVHEVAGRRMLGTARSRGPADSIFALVDHLTLEILRLIPGSDSTGRAHLELARVNTASLPALKAFLEGEVRFRRSQFENAAVAYERAVKADSTFALARYRLGVSRQWFWNDMLGATPDPLATTVGRFAGRLPEHEAAMFRAYLLGDQDVAAARDLLEEEARRHPEDADTWYQLGEFYHHRGGAALVPPGAADRALARAITLDSTFSLAYIHRIEYAVKERDTASADRLLLMFARLAPDTRHVAQLRLLAGLVVGDAVARSTSEAELDKLETDRLFWLGYMLYAARRFDLAEQVFLRARKQPEFRPDATIPLFFASLAQGKAHEAGRWLNDADMPEARRASMLQALAELGVQVRVRERDTMLPLNTADTVAAFQLFYLGAFAASQGRWDVAQGWVDRLQHRATSLRAAGDASGADFTEALQAGTEGYLRWRQGHRERALSLLKRSQRRVLCCPAPLVNERLRWWLGKLLLEMGRPQEARPYFESLAATWLPADYELGRVYQQLGMAEQAREAYARFLVPRQQADSAFQPMILDARTALERLSGGAP